MAMSDSSDKNLSQLLRQQRVSLSLTLTQVATKAGISPSHLGRIERAERFPSARILRKIAEPLGFNEGELFVLAGFFSHEPTENDVSSRTRGSERLDPYVASVLSQEPVSVQRAVIGILSILKVLRKVEEGVSPQSTPVDLTQRVP